jgi:hypothetical protein
VGKVVECVGVRYEAQDVEMGKVYICRPAIVTVECDCGETPILSSSRTTCFECQADHTYLIREVLATPMEEDEGDHPWRYLRSYFSHPKPI